MRSKLVEFHFCPCCNSPVQGKAGRCARCRWGPASSTSLQKGLSRLKKVMPRLRERRYAGKDVPLGICPNCREIVPQDARKCSRCNWESNYTGRDRSSGKQRRLVQSLHSALRYERRKNCTYCGCEVRTSNAFCPDCLTPFQTVEFRPSLSATAGAWIRSRRAKIGVERAALCPNCDLYVPPWADTCYCCGWICPPRPGVRAVLRTLGQNANQGASFITRLSVRASKADGDICPNCEVCIRPSDRICMICGWKPARRRRLQDHYRAFGAGRAQWARRVQQNRVRPCEQCDMALLPGYDLCMVCGWKPDPTALQRMIAVPAWKRKAVVQDRPEAQCPNCLIGLANKARQCGACGWNAEVVRSWGRHPRLIWLAPVCVALFCSLITVCLHAADPANTRGHIDRYGRNGSQRHPWDAILTNPHSDQ